MPIPTDSIYELTNQLARVRITRQRAIQQITQAREEEAALLMRIESEMDVRATTVAAANNNEISDNTQ